MIACMCFLEQEASLTLLQPTQLYNGYSALAGEGKAGLVRMKTYFIIYACIADACGYPARVKINTFLNMIKTATVK